MSSNFVHLHVHSDNSLLDGANSIDRLVRRATEFEMPALALTDHGVLYGAWEFQETARKQGIKPIIGMEAYVAPGHRGDRKMRTRQGKAYYHLVLLARDLKGYHNLVKLSSYGFKEGFYYNPRVDRELLERYSEGLIVTSACMAGEIAQHLMAGDEDAAAEAAAWYAEVFKDRYYLEVQAHNSEGQAELNARIFKLAERLGLPVVATNDVHFLRREDHQAHDTLICIGLQKDKADPARLHYDEGLYFKNGDEMAAFFRDRDDVLANSLAIAEQVDVQFRKTYHVPAFPLAEEERAALLQRAKETGVFDAASDYAFLKDAALSNEDREQRIVEIQLLRDLAYAGAHRRFGEKLPDEVVERLEYELGVISGAGYAGYHLIVQDFIAWARSQGIPVGPGRGSAAGSLVCYCLGITNLDPLKYDLLFERFLNPARVSMPDIDVDFDYERRGEVIEYVRQKYGRDAVCQIVTFGTLKSRAVVRDVGRVLGFSPAETDRLAKMIPNAPNFSLTVAEAIERVADVRALYDSDPRYRELLDMASQLEGLRRHASVHAAGVVIAPGPVDDYVPVAVQNDSLVTQYAMTELEKAGMLKMDFLGLKTLTVIADTIRMVNERYPDLDLTPEKIPFDDHATYELIRSGRTAGVFQLESALATEKLQAMRADCFEDLVATNALIRPGPLDSGMCDAYIRRKRGEEEVTYPHPALKDVLASTYGIIVYQEQVMRAAQILANYSLAEADVLRKAVGKKDAQLIKEELERFVERAVAAGTCDRAKAEEIAALIETFGRYGFNRSHSAAYSVISIQTAYLKAHYPAEFMAALLSSVIDKTEDVVAYLNEAREMKIPVLPPSVSESGWKFTVVDRPDGTRAIRFGLGAIRGVGAAVIDAVIAARQEAPFTDFFDFVRRCAGPHLNRRVLEALIFSGALDELGANRAQMLAVADAALKASGVERRDAELGQLGLFSGVAESVPAIAMTPAMPDIPDLDPKERLAREKEVLGVYVSGHPLDRIEDVVRVAATHQASDLQQYVPGTIRVAGVVTQVNRATSRRDGREYAKITIEDMTGTVNAIVFADQWARFRHMLQPDALIVVTGSFSDRDRDSEKQPDLRVEQAMPLLEAMAAGEIVMAIRVGPDGPSEDLLARARMIMDAHPGASPILVEYVDEKGRTLRMRRGKNNEKVRFSPELLAELRSLLGPDRVRVLSARTAEEIIGEPLVQTSPQRSGVAASRLQPRLARSR